MSLQWRYNGRDSVSNHQPHDCLLNRLFRRRSNKTSKLRVTGLCAGNSPGTDEFSAQMASYAKIVSIWWRHHVNNENNINNNPADMMGSTSSSNVNNTNNYNNNKHKGPMMQKEFPCQNINLFLNNRWHVFQPKTTLSDNIPTKYLTVKL